MIVASGEDDGGGLVADEAFGNAGLAEVGGGGAALLEDGVGADDLDGEGVAARPRLQLLHLRKHRLLQCGLRYVSLRCCCSRRHG